MSSHRAFRGICVVKEFLVMCCSSISSSDYQSPRYHHSFSSNSWHVQLHNKIRSEVIIDGTWMDIWTDLQTEALGEEMPQNYRIPFRNDCTYVLLQNAWVPVLYRWRHYHKSIVLLSNRPICDNKFSDLHRQIS